MPLSSVRTCGTSLREKDQVSTHRDRNTTRGRRPGADGRRSPRHRSPWAVPSTNLVIVKIAFNTLVRDN